MLPDCRKIGVVEDDPIMGGSLQQRLILEGYDVDWWRCGRDAVAGIREEAPDLVVCDLRLPDMHGEELFQTAVSRIGTPPFLFITAYGEIDQAVRLMRAGAGDYLTKPFIMDDFLGRVEDLLSKRPPLPSGMPVLGVSAAMRAVEQLLRRIADLESSLFITGETGVGKEVCAQFVHDVSAAAERPFIAVNCAAIPSELLDSELFGHEKGAFTGAHAQHLGYAERARDGVLFLDEIGDLPPHLQAKLLRLVQERSFNRVGGEVEIPFSARIICSTNRNLDLAAKNGKFREDLFYRINVIPVHIPPLRERADDILPLLHHYTEHFVSSMSSALRGISTPAEEAAQAHDWPGNVRELCNRVERAVALANGELLTPGDLFPEVEAAGDPAVGALSTLVEVREAAERRQILRALAQTEGQIVKAAALLGVSRTTLWEKMKRLNIKADA